MKDGWRFITTTWVVSFIYVYHDPPTKVGDFFMYEVMTPHIGHHPMHDNYIGLNPPLQIIMDCGASHIFMTWIPVSSTGIQVN